MVDRIKSLLLAAAFVALGMSVLPAAASAQSQSASPIEVARAYADALNSEDEARALSLVDPNGEIIFDPGTPMEAHEKLGTFTKDSIGAVHVRIVSVSQTDATTVESDHVLTGSNIPPVPHPFTAHATFTVENGRITRMVQVLSQQTMEDLQALGPPPSESAGMPRTGAGISELWPWLWVPIAAGLVVAISSVAIRRHPAKSGDR